MTRDTFIVCDHDDGIFCLFMEDADELHDALGIFLIEIARRLVREEIWYPRDKCSCDSHALLLSS